MNRIKINGIKSLKKKKVKKMVVMNEERVI